MTASATNLRDERLRRNGPESYRARFYDTENQDSVTQYFDVPTFNCGIRLETQLCQITMRASDVAMRVLEWTEHVGRVSYKSRSITF